MSFNKNAKKTITRRLLTTVFAGLAVSAFMLATSNVANAQPACSLGKYDPFYQKCLTAPVNGNCPPGTKKDNTVPPPNNCEIDTGTNPSNPGGGGGTVNLGGGQGKYTCGEGADAVKISINIGCVQKGTATVDAAFAIIRFLSLGVGLVVIGSIVLGGVQYSASRGDPNATSQAIKRIRNSIYALFIYIFAAAILNFLIPQGFFNL